MDLSNVSTILGILGAYFAVVLVLAVSVETILEPFTSLPWLSKKPNPDDILNDIQTWLPASSNVEVKALAVQNLTTEFKTTETQLENTVKDLKDVADQALDALIRRLRDRLSALDPQHQYIDTIRGHGVRLDNPPA